MIADDDDDTSLEDERYVELSSIAAIFPELVRDSKNPYSASILLPVSPDPPINIVFPALADAAAPSVDLPTPPRSDGSAREDQTEEKDEDHAEGELEDTHLLSHLPPLYLQIELCKGYPSDAPPKFELSTSPSWIPEKTLASLVDYSKILWEESGRDQVIFAFIDHLQQSAERGFDISDGQSPFLFKIDRDMKISLLDFDRKAKQEKFDQESFDCGICLYPKKGSSCHRLELCGHVFCVECLQDFYNNCITEGDVMSVKCLDPGCGKTPIPPAEQAGEAGKEDRTIQPCELLQISIAQDQVKRYVALKRKTELESDKNTIYCPRKWCQGAARSSTMSPKPFGDTSEESNSQSDRRLAICGDCSYAFCSICEAGWHGELQYCHPRNPAELSADEKASEEYLRRHSSPCPTCDAPCQKSQGCNHMICFRCSTHFCYLCSAWLNAGNPYEHFNNEWGTCFMRLWEMEGGDGEELDADGEPNARPRPDGAGNVADGAGAGAGAGPDAQGNHRDNFDIDDIHIDEHEMLQFILAAMPEAPVPPQAAPPPAAVARVIAQPGARDQAHRGRGRGGGRGGRGRGGRGGQGRVDNQHHLQNQQHAPPPQQNLARQAQGGRGRGQQQQQQQPHRHVQPGAVDRGRRGGADNRPVPPPLPPPPQAQPQAQAQLPHLPAPAIPNDNELPRLGGIHRFLEMVERDEEDEWDSDELSEEGEEWDRFR